MARNQWISISSTRRAVVSFAISMGIVIATFATLSSDAGASYRGSSAAYYANLYWTNYNSDYPNYGSTDCTNYVSQALNWNTSEMNGKQWVPNGMTTPLSTHDPGIVSDPSDPGYWYGEPSWTDSTPEYSYSWTVAQYLFWFLELYDGSDSSWVYTFHYYGGYTAPSEPSGMALGDPWFYNWDALDNGLGANGVDHSSITALQGSGTDGTVGDEVDTHSNDRHEVLWTLKYVSNPSNPNVATEEVFGVHVSS